MARDWKTWEIELTKTVMLEGMAEGKGVTEISRQLAPRLDNRTSGAALWYWNARIAPGIPKEIELAYKKAEKAKGKPNPKKETKKTTVVLPFKIFAAIETVKKKYGEEKLYDLKFVLQNEVLGKYLVEPINTQTYFKALNEGYMPDKTPEDVLVETLVTYYDQGKWKNIDGAILTLKSLERDDLIDKYHAMRKEVGNK